MKLALIIVAALGVGTDGINPRSQVAAPIGSAVGDVNMVGYKLTLDVDKDTYLYSSADDIYDLFAGGQLYFQLTTTNATFDVNAVFDDCGTDCNSYSLSMSADNSTTAQEAKLQVMYGADPYLRILAPNDSGTATPVLDVHDTTITYGNGAAGVDYTIDFNGETNDGYFLYDEDNDRFTFNETVQTNGGVWLGGTNMKLSSAADGNLLMTDNAGTSFGKMYFGGTSSSYPMLTISGSTLQNKLGDNTAFTAFESKRYIGTSVFGAAFSLQINSQYAVCDGTNEVVTSTLVNAGSFLFSVASRNISNIVGPSSFDIGDGQDKDIFGTQTVMTAGATTDGSYRTGTFNGLIDTALPITISYSSNCTSGTIVVVAYLLVMTAPTQGTP